MTSTRNRPVGPANLRQIARLLSYHNRLLRAGRTLEARAVSSCIAILRAVPIDRKSEASISR